MNIMWIGRLPLHNSQLYLHNSQIIYSIKKKTAFALILSIGTLLIVFSFTHTSWSAASSVIPELYIATPALDINTLPLNVPDETIKHLEDFQDADLQNQLEAIVSSDSRWLELSKNNSLSIGIVDMQDPLHSRFAAINGDYMMYAASLSKSGK